MNSLVSICIVTFNHEKYILESVQSALAQDYKNTEVIIVDDGSTDRTWQLLQSIQDPRLKVINKKNSGPSDAINLAIKNSNGQWIALLSGDDVMLPMRISTSLGLMQSQNFDMIFSNPILIDESSQEYGKTEKQIFQKISYCSSDELFRELFFKTNFLCAPTCFARANVLKENEFLSSSIQLQDFELWTRLAKKYKIGIKTEPDTYYRFVSHSQNLSGEKNILRTRFEMLMIYENIFADFEYQDIERIFATQYPNFFNNKKYKNKLAATGFLYLEHRLPVVRAVGARQLFKLMSTELGQKILIEDYQFDHQKLFQLMNEIDFMNIKTAEKYQQLGHLGRQLVEVLLRLKFLIKRLIGENH